MLICAFAGRIGTNTQNDKALGRNDAGTSVATVTGHQSLHKPEAELKVRNSKARTGEKPTPTRKDSAEGHKPRTATERTVATVI